MRMHGMGRLSRARIEPVHMSSLVLLEPTKCQNTSLFAAVMPLYSSQPCAMHIDRSCLRMSSDASAVTGVIANSVCLGDVLFLTRGWTICRLRHRISRTAIVCTEPFRDPPELWVLQETICLQKSDGVTSARLESQKLPGAFREPPIAPVAVNMQNPSNFALSTRDYRTLIIHRTRQYLPRCPTV